MFRLTSLPIRSPQPSTRLGFPSSPRSSGLTCNSLAKANHDSPWLASIEPKCILATSQVCGFYISGDIYNNFRWFVNLASTVPKHKDSSVFVPKCSLSLPGVSNVFTLATLGIAFLMIFSIFAGNFVESTAEIQATVSQQFSWFYACVMNIHVLVCLGLALSPVGRMRLSSSEADRPRFGTFSWLAMLFSAGMGIGLFFYGVVEPLSHEYFTFSGVGAGSPSSVSLTMFHWGIHPWSCYAIVGLCFAYFSYRKGRSFSILSTLPQSIASPRLKNLISTATVVCPVVGVATSLGLGAMQIAKGLDVGFSISASIWSQTVVILLITGLATLSVVSGVERGMKFLSNFNMLLAFVFLAMIFGFIFSGEALWLIVTDTVDYFTELPGNAVWTAGHDYQASGNTINWTSLHWANWIAWAPFVGMFIAKISKGRTIREYILGVTLVPTLLSAVWFSVLGNSAMALLSEQSSQLLGMLRSDPAQAFFVYLSHFSGGFILFGLALVSLKLFFITSSDSAALVIATAAAEGKEPSRFAKVYWSLVISLLAIVFLANGGLETMQVVSVVSAIPFAFISMVMVGCLLADLWRVTCGYRNGSKKVRTFKPKLVDS